MIRVVGIPTLHALRNVGPAPPRDVDSRRDFRGTPADDCRRGRRSVGPEGSSLVPSCQGTGGVKWGPGKSSNYVENPRSRKSKVPRKKDPL